MTTEALVPAAAEPAIAPSGAGEIVLPQVIVDAGPSAVARFLEFFAGRIANARTRAAYGRAVGQFLGWCEARGLRLRDVSPLHVAAYIRTHPGSVPTVKQHLAAIRMLRRLARRQPGPPGEPRRCGARPEARRHERRDAGPLASRGEEAPRVDRHGHAGRAPGPSAPVGHALQLRAGERGIGDAAAGLLRAGEPGVVEAPGWSAGARRPGGAGRHHDRGPADLCSTSSRRGPSSSGS